MVALNDFTPLQGGVPISVKGSVLGAIGVSGASSAQQDEEFASAGANALIKALGGEPLANTQASPTRAHFARAQSMFVETH